MWTSLTYFEDVLFDVDESDILLKWNDAASFLDMSSELTEMFKLKIKCKDWRETDIKTVQWRAKMIKYDYSATADRTAV